MNRRTFIAAAGAGLTATAAGCLSRADPSGGSNPSDDDDPSGDENGDPSAKPDDPIYTVSLEDDRLEDAGEFAALAIELVDPYVGPESPAALEATLSNTTDEPISVSSGAPWPFGVVWADPADGSESITLWNDAYEEDGHVGTDGTHVRGVDDIGLIDELEGDASITQTFELHEETPNLEAGTYEASVTCWVSPEDVDESEGLGIELVLTVAEDESESDGKDENVIPETPRVDEPPYEIVEPEAPDGPDEEDAWNEHYLGEKMPEEPSLEFEALERVQFESLALSPMDGDGDRYAVDLLESEADRDERIDLGEMDEEDRDRLESVEFDDQVLVVVESGFGSGSVRHRWRRVEAVEDGVHAHGYYTQPFERTDDYTSRTSVLVVDRPDDGALELARVSLTVDAETRVHFNSTEGVVTARNADE